MLEANTLPSGGLVVSSNPDRLVLVEREAAIAILDGKQWGKELKIQESLLLEGVRSGGELPGVYAGVVDKYGQLAHINGTHDLQVALSSNYLQTLQTQREIA